MELIYIYDNLKRMPLYHENMTFLNITSMHNCQILVVRTYFILADTS